MMSSPEEHARDRSLARRTSLPSVDSRLSLLGRAMNPARGEGA
jgi:hypothetical protein